MPHPCKCGCEKIVGIHITERTERTHLTKPGVRVQAVQQMAIPKPFDLASLSGPSHRTSAAADMDIIEDPGYSNQDAGPADLNQTEPLAPGSDIEMEDDMDHDSESESVHFNDQDNDTTPVDISLDGAPRPVQEALKAWKDQRASVEDVIDLEEDDEAEEDNARAHTLYDNGWFDYDQEEDYHLNMDQHSEEMEERMANLIADFVEDIDDDDLDILRAYSLKLDNNLTDATFRQLPQAFPKHNIASLKVTRKRVEFLAKFRPQPFDCCINSCLCYTGAYEKADKCRFCKELRYNASGKARKRFNYIPLTARLSALYGDKATAEKMRYRHEYKHHDGVYEDVFDGRIYQNLCKTKVEVGEEEQDHTYFQDATDIALGFATDGFAPFKNRKQTCWPILVYNYNLPPSIRFLFENLICVGVIPGPRKPKDMDSFLWPFVIELLGLALGVRAFHGVLRAFFTLRAYLILGGGDMPAVAMLMLMKGSNGVYPCRMCKIRGVLKPGSTTYYCPLVCPKALPIPADVPAQYDPAKLPLRSHNEFIDDGEISQSTRNPTEAERRSKESGVKGVPILSQLPSLFFPMSFPFDFMHLIYENVVKNLISFWCADFKDLDHSNAPYVIENSVWKGICEATADAGRTTPLAYGPAIPNMSEDGVTLTADMYSFWVQFLGPVVLQGCFPNRTVYAHFVALVKLITKCLQFTITEDELGEIRDGFIQWVQEYERIYYQYKADRLSACPSTIHALLHIADGIRALGPVWVYWAFPMERFCGRLARFIRSRRFPFSHLDNQVLAHAQLTQIKNMYRLHDELSLDPPKNTSKMWGFTIPGELYKEYTLVSPHSDASMTLP